MLQPNGLRVILACEDCGEVFKVVNPSRHTLAGLRELDESLTESHECKR